MSGITRNNSLRTWHIDAAGLAIVVGLMLGLYFGRVEPLLAARERWAAEATELAAQQSKVRGLELSLQTVHNSLTSVQQALSAQHLQLQPPSHLNACLARLAELANSHQVQIDSLESGAVSAHDRYGVVVIRMSGRCGYRNFTQMLRTMRGKMPDLAVAAMELTSADGTSGSNASFVTELCWFTIAPAHAVRK